MSELTLEVAISFCSEMAKKEVYEKVKKGNKMAEYGYVDVDKLCEFANNSTVGLTANDIMRFPRADVQPIRHGRWDFQGYQLFKCTNCTKIYTQEQLEDIGENRTFPNFCPNCGAKMTKQ